MARSNAGLMLRRMGSAGRPEVDCGNAGDKLQ